MPRNKKNKGGGGGNAAPPKISTNNPIPLRAPDTPAASVVPVEDSETLKIRLAEAKDRLTRVEAVIETIGAQRQSTDAAIAEAAQKLDKIGAIVDNPTAVESNPSQLNPVESNTGTVKKNKKHNKHKVHNLIPPEGAPALPIQKVDVQHSLPKPTQLELPPDAEVVGEIVENNQGGKNKKKNKNKNKQPPIDELGSTIKEAHSETKVVESKIESPPPKVDVVPTADPEKIVESNEETPCSGDGKKKKNKNKNKNKQTKEEQIETGTENVLTPVEKLIVVAPKVIPVVESLNVATKLESQLKIEDNANIQIDNQKSSSQIEPAKPILASSDSTPSKKKNKNKTNKNEPTTKDIIESSSDSEQLFIKSSETLAVIQEGLLQSSNLGQLAIATSATIVETNISAVEHAPMVPKSEETVLETPKELQLKEADIKKGVETIWKILDPPTDVAVIESNVKQKKGNKKDVEPKRELTLLPESIPAPEVAIAKEELCENSGPITKVHEDNQTKPIELSMPGSDKDIDMKPLHIETNVNIKLQSSEPIADAQPTFNTPTKDGKPDTVTVATHVKHEPSNKSAKKQADKGNKSTASKLNEKPGDNQEAKTTECPLNKVASTTQKPKAKEHIEQPSQVSAKDDTKAQLPTSEPQVENKTSSISAKTVKIDENDPPFKCTELPNKVGAKGDTKASLPKPVPKVESKTSSDSVKPIKPETGKNEPFKIDPVKTEQVNLKPAEKRTDTPEQIIPEQHDEKSKNEPELKLLENRDVAPDVKDKAKSLDTHIKSDEVASDDLTKGKPTESVITINKSKSNKSVDTKIESEISVTVAKTPTPISPLKDESFAEKIDPSKSVAPESKVVKNTTSANSPSPPPCVSAKSVKVEVNKATIDASISTTSQCSVTKTTDQKSTKLPEDKSDTSKCAKTSNKKPSTKVETKKITSSPPGSKPQTIIPPKTESPLVDVALVVTDTPNLGLKSVTANEPTTKKDSKQKTTKVKAKAPQPPRTEESPAPSEASLSSASTIVEVGTASSSVVDENAPILSDSKNVQRSASVRSVDVAAVKSPTAESLQINEKPVDAAASENTPVKEVIIESKNTSPTTNKRNKNESNIQQVNGDIEAKTLEIPEKSAQQKLDPPPPSEVLLMDILEPKLITGTKPGVVAGNVRVKASATPKKVVTAKKEPISKDTGAIPKTVTAKENKVSPPPTITTATTNKQGSPKPEATPKSPKSADKKAASPKRDISSKQGSPKPESKSSPPKNETNRAATPVKSDLKTTPTPKSASNKSPTPISKTTKTPVKPTIPPRPTNLVASPTQPKKATSTSASSSNASTPSPNVYDDEEYIEYKFSPRPVFMSTICQTCKIPLQSFVHCKQCMMISYCTVEHLQEDVPSHQPLCTAIQEIAKKRGGHIYNNARILNDDDYRSLRVHTLNLCENSLKRHLQPYEREILLFPRLCSSGPCREWRQHLLTECKTCGQVSYCASNPDHLAESHSKWCQAFALYQKLVVTQKHYGRIEPSLPSKIMSKEYQLTATIDETFRNLYKNYGAIKDECTYAALTQLATAPLTAYYGIQLSGQSIGDRFTIHLVGAELQFEADTLDKWETFFLHLAPQLIELRIVFVGPELNAENLPLEILSRIRMCRACRQNCRAVKFDFQCGTLYHSYVKGKSFTKPDMVCFFNPGLYRSTGFNGQDTWPDTIQAAMSVTAPVLVTSYTEVEAPRDLDRLQKESGRTLEILKSPHINPFASQRPERNFISDEVAPMIFKNFYCFVCK